MGLISSVWKFASDIWIEAMENSTFIFHFGRCQDKSRVLQLAPWNFKGFYLVLQHWSPELTIDEVDLSLADLLDPTYGLPMAGMNKSNIRATRVEVLRD